MGILQGIVEWLPISSQGNLVLLAIAFLGLESGNVLIFSVFLHIGTGLAALIYLRTEIVRILKRKTKEDETLFRFLLLSTMVTGIVGLPLFVFVELASFYGDALLGLTGLALLATGLTQRSRENRITQQRDDLDLREGVILGIIQGFSAIPGISRSGLTTTALLLKGFSGKDAFRISFLMSIPASLAAATGLALIEGVPPLDVGFLLALGSSFFTALLSIDILVKLAQRARFWKLCIALGLISIGAIFLNFI